ncbi:2-amino-4-hydroxy-6-hydroxymethyldihydropteridine diphosphokinase [bacterium]|nr:2-amino-4-hydroxy-6-hydroxymethyldihydropteridine diphosphokinase [bacterium]
MKLRAFLHRLSPTPAIDVVIDVAQLIRSNLNRRLVMIQAAVAIGGNLGDVPATIAAACEELARHESISDLHCSHLFRSTPMGSAAGDPFWNAACVFATSLDPYVLLAELQRVENSAGRTRAVRWGPRTLDLDLILYGDKIVESETLTVPHPHFWYRRFVLGPLAELIPNVVPPRFSLSILELAARLRQRPFRLQIGGECDIADVRGVVDRFVAEDRSKEIKVELPSRAEPARAASLALWFGDSRQQAPTDDESLLLRCAEYTPQVLTDVLAAAVGKIERT